MARRSPCSATCTAPGRPERRHGGGRGSGDVPDAAAVAPGSSGSEGAEGAAGSAVAARTVVAAVAGRSRPPYDSGT